MLKKLMLLALCLALLLPCLAIAEEERMEITYVSWYCGEIEDGNWAEKLLEDKFNVDIKVSRVDLSNNTQVSLMLASNEMPECGWQISDPAELYRQEMVRVIPEEMIREHAPLYSAMLDKDPIGWKYFRADGGHYALTGYTPNTNAFMLAIRLDWMENLGMELPEDMLQLDEEGYLFCSSKRYTVSELYDMMEQFTYGDPDGNGEDDTIGFQSAMQDNFIWLAMESAFGFAPTCISEFNGEAANYYITDNYRDFLTWMADVYANGLTDQEFATVDRNVAWEKYANGNAGIIGTMAEWVSSETWCANRAPMSIVSAKSGKMLVVPSPTNDEGENTSPAYNFNNYKYAFVVRDDVSDEKLAKILEIMDYCTMDPEGKVLMRYGVEGVHYTLNNPENGSGLVLNEGVSLGADTGLAVFNSNYIIESDLAALVANDTTNALKEHVVYDYMEIQMKPYALDIFNETRLNELSSEYDPTIMTLVNEYFYNAICGEVDIDETWDDYVQSLYDAGYDKIHEELQKVPVYE